MRRVKVAPIGTSYCSLATCTIFLGRKPIELSMPIGFSFVIICIERGALLDVVTDRAGAGNEGNGSNKERVDSASRKQMLVPE